MLINQEIEATYLIDPGEDAPWPEGRLVSDGRRWTTECECCGQPSSYHFTTPDDPMGNPVNFCLPCLVNQPDVIKIVIGPQD